MLRRALPADTEAIQQLIDENRETLLPRDDKELERLLPSFFVIEKEGEVIGCCCLEVYSQKIAEIRTVAVKSSLRQHGYGTQLVKAALAEGKARGIKEILVVTSNLKFFEQLNFTTCLNEKYALFWKGDTNDGQF